jgi:hypothetical protein
VGEPLVVCDRCRLKTVMHYGRAQRFILLHLECNFTGLRVVRADHPCPTRERSYENGVYKVWKDPEKTHAK